MTRMLNNLRSIYNDHSDGRYVAAVDARLRILGGLQTAPRSELN
jgi:hypothetical protein